MPSANLSQTAITELVFALPTEQWKLRLVPDDEHEEISVKSPVYTGSQLIKAVRYLRHENMSGHHVYGRPLTSRHVLIDDLDQDALDCLTHDNLKPNVCVRTSKGNHQVWITVSNDEIDLTLAANIAKILANRYGGDVGSTDAHHLGRFPGFTNRKDIYLTGKGFPFTGLHGPVRRGVPNGAAKVMTEAESISASAPASPPYTQGGCAPTISNLDIDPPRSPMTQDEAIGIYNAELQFQAGRNDWKLPIQKGNRSEADYAVAAGLRIRYGYEPDDIAAVQFHGSDKAKERGMDYVNSTVNAALRNT